MSFSSFFSWKKLADSWRLFLLCLLLFIVSSIFSFWIFFPADVVQRRLLLELSSQTGVDMRGENATILLPLGLSLDLFVYPNREGFADFKLEKLQITPVWSRLFSTDPAIQIDGKLASGAVDGEGSHKGDVRLNFEDISVLSLQESDLPYRISGLLNGELHGEGMTDPLSGRGEFAFVLKDGAALGLEKIGLPGRLVIGTLRLAGKFNQRRFSLEKVLLRGGVLDLSGGGNILIGETPEQTRLNLNIRLQPTGITSEALLDMLKLTGVRPTTDGSYLLRIGGTLAKPMVR